MSEPAAGLSGIRTDQDWTSQAHDYHGTAWYGVEFACPAELAGKKALLRFGAVDGICHVWLDANESARSLSHPTSCGSDPSRLHWAHWRPGGNTGWWSALRRRRTVRGSGGR